ncbi:hypothetical protein ICV35_26680 [Rhodococcus ruber]|uniref:hypothetical protein n=1 Tax=Rhodococcus ruber TaxID=1830 RepID=UPI0017825DE8|nr:hypothetical protein [Rhodococcus ruber]MBD8057226.1 hypothetical protein [Rhodococcus ruber]
MSSNDIGPQYTQPDPRGWLVFEYLPDHLQAREDATLAADHERAAHGLRSFTRPATDTERVLLEHLGYGHITEEGTRALPTDLATTVVYHSPGIRRRTFPALEA